MESTAWVVCPAGGGAVVVVAAVGDALVAPLGADKVWQGLGVLGGIWRLAVAADAVVGERGCVTVVRLGLGGVAGGLQADQRTLSELGIAPDLCTKSVSWKSYLLGEIIRLVDRGTLLGLMLY